LRILLLIPLIFEVSQTQTLPLSAKVTYVSVGTVYVSAGRGSGVTDSTLLYVVAGKDTIAVLKVFAVSSKSSACTIVRSNRDVEVGDLVVGLMQQTEKKEIVAGMPPDTVKGMLQREDVRVRGLRSQEEPPAIAFQGRASLQNLSVMYENTDYNLYQPGIVLNVRALARDVPIKMEIYGNLRTLARGTASPFSGSASNESRIYRFSLEYDDKANVLTLGRILPQYAPSIGSIDGVSYSRKLGNFVAGGSIGFQPTPRQQGISTDTRKLALFGQFQTREPFDLSITAAYSRTYLFSQLDREAVSFMINAFTLDGLSFYSYGDVDIRKKIDSSFEVSPALSTAIIGVNYRVADFLTLGLGADASRPIYPFSSVQSLADSLLDRKLRSGATFSINLTIGYGLGLYNSFTPRSLDGPFGEEYTNSSSLYLSNAFSSGVMVRSSLTVSSNSMTSGIGYGINLQRNIYGVDATVRYQQSQYKILQFDQTSRNETFGLDIIVLLSNRLSFVTSVDATRGFGSNSNAIFSELSWRF
jgi:hypothetical protein